MEVQVQELINSIKNDGIQAAEEESKKIIEQAENKAEQIIKDAEKKADSIISEGENKVARKESSSKASLNQAGRDLIISLEKKITAILNSILERKVSEALDSKTLEKVILEVVKSDITKDYKVLEISTNLKKDLKDGIMADLQKEMKAGIDIHPVDSIENGFRITDKDGSGYVSFTSEDIAAMLSPFIQKELHQIITDAE
ncbi:MAG: hypothetical protein K9L24_00925 [Spirochaetia bacterium]|nr:hypothetical protein [Spirochaetia bacterium]MCF7946332.1 hypothetical protein [Spirochaetia bacterium]